MSISSSELFQVNYISCVFICTVTLLNTDKRITVCSQYQTGQPQGQTVTKNKTTTTHSHNHTNTVSIVSHLQNTQFAFVSISISISASISISRKRNYLDNTLMKNMQIPHKTTC